MIHAILHSNLPASEKEVLRVFDDVSTVTAAVMRRFRGRRGIVLGCSKLSSMNEGEGG